MVSKKAQLLGAFVVVVFSATSPSKSASATLLQPPHEAKCKDEFESLARGTSRDPEVATAAVTSLGTAKVMSDAT